MKNLVTQAMVNVQTDSRFIHRIRTFIHKMFIVLQVILLSLLYFQVGLPGHFWLSRSRSKFQIQYQSSQRPFKVSYFGETQKLELVKMKKSQPLMFHYFFLA